MKSTMKSAFAIIAVALMIMVAVVPMVGVFTEESDAATIVPDTTKSITVSGTVMDSDSQKIKDVLVKVSYGSYYEYGLTGSNGTYSITVNYSGTSIDATVSIVTDPTEYTNITGYTTNPVEEKFDSGASQTIYSVTGNVSGIDFMSGYVAITGKLTYANTSVAYDKVVTVSAQEEASMLRDAGYTGKSDATTGVYTILVPINSGKMIISAEGFNEKTVDVKKVNVTSGTDLANKDTYKAFVAYADVDNTLSAEPGSGITSTDFDKVLGEDGKYTGQYSFTYTFKEEGDKKITISDTKGYGYAQDMTLTTSPSVYTFKENAYISGTITMGNVLIAGAIQSNLSVIYYKDSTPLTEAAITGETKEIVAGTGVYTVAFGKVADFGEANKVQIVYTLDTGIKASSQVISIPSSAAATQNISFSSTGYYLISGTIKNGSTPVPLVKVDITSTGAEGTYNGAVETDLNGKYAFYAKADADVTITPADATYIPSSQSFKAIANKTVDFTMDSKTVTSTVAIMDALGNVLKDVTVKYRVTDLGTYADATFNSNGTFSVTVPSYVDADEIQVYFTKTGYTFAATADSPATMADSEFKAIEQTLTFNVKDFAGQAIAGISDITFQVAKYRIHAVGEDIKAYEIIGSLSDVAYDATAGTFSFIAKYIANSSADYREQYGISVKSNSTVYTFDTITEFANEFTIKAKEQTFTGEVKDAANKPLAGMTVAVYDSATKTTKISADVTTYNDGTFSIVSKAGYVKVTDLNGIYTFVGAATSDLASPIKANEKEYSGAVEDADEQAVKNADISVKVVDTQGKTVGSVAKVGADGTFKIITAVVDGYKVVTTDNEGVRTFADVTLAGTETELSVVSGQYTLSGTVKILTAGTAIKDITVTLSIYTATVSPVVVDTDVTDKDGKFSFLVDVASAGQTYGVVASDSGIYRFSTEKTVFTDRVANISTEYEIKQLIVMDGDDAPLEGIKVTVKSGATVVGEYTTDENGNISYPAIAGVTFTAVDPKGLYTFDANETGDEINANEATHKVTVEVKLNGGTTEVLPGISVNFIDEDGKIVKTVVTDSKGVATAVLERPLTYKAVDATTKYGAVTFPAAASGTTIETNETVYSGYYASGDVVSGVVVTYQIFEGQKFVEKGKAVVIDNMYYIATAKTGSSITVEATADKFYAKGAFNSMTAIGGVDLAKQTIAGVVTLAESRGLNELYFVYNYASAQVGDKILLSAVNVSYQPIESGNETTVVKYTFNGWYVNGVKVSDDLEYTYTVTEECVVYADYKVSSYETAPSNGVDSTVLIIGIAAVIIALFAVIYAVIQKRE